MTEEAVTTISGAEKIRLQTAEALEDAARKLRSADMAQSSEDVQNILHSVQDKMDHLKEEIGARYHELEVEYHKQVEPVENTIRDHPIPAVLIAIGVGFLFGMLVGKYRD